MSKTEKNKNRTGFKFSLFQAEEKSLFERLFDIFKELITHTSGDFDEAMDWLGELDKEYKLTNEDYTLDDFVEELKKKGYLREEIKPDGTGGKAITAKTERAIRKNALNLWHVDGRWQVINNSVENQLHAFVFKG